MEDRSSRWIIEEEKTEASNPEWFENAIAQTPESRHITVQDCEIHYLRWGPTVSEKPGILFVHGGAAHAHWWSFIAPFFCDDRAIAAIDLSGMGDSSRREVYETGQRVAEMIAVMEDAALGERPVVVGHSFGGYMTMCCGHNHGTELSGVVIVDSFVRPPSEDNDGPREPGRPKPYFPDKATVVRRYRLAPYQACENEFLVDYIARHAVVEEERGWTWKYDDATRHRGQRAEPLSDYLRDMACPKALIYGVDSVMATDDALDYTRECFKSEDHFIGMPAAGHHLMLDQPIAFVTCLRAILSGWGA